MRAFEGATLEAFPHAAHVRAGFLMLRESASVAEALARFTVALRRFAAARGAHGKYHETITWSFMFLIHERMAESDAPHSLTWPAFIAAHPELLDAAILRRYYRPETLASSLARRTFVMPDRLTA